MLRQTIAYSLLLILALLYVQNTFANTWRELAPGIEYQDLNRNTLMRWSHVHAFRIDLKRNTLDLIMADEFSQKQASVHEFAHKSNALIAINGGFFDQDYQPLGLRISHRKQRNPLKRISWWGVFYIENHTAHLSSLLAFKPNEHIDFALQTGPRLLVHGKILRLKPGYAERSALGITAEGQLIIVVTEHLPMTTTTLAEQMKASPLHCTEALNVDGGASSQLYASIGTFRIDAPGFSNVSDAIVVKPR